MIVCTLALSVHGATNRQVVPHHLFFDGGNNDSQAPFFPDPGPVKSMRYQQVYNFVTGVPSEGALITRMFIRTPDFDGFIGTVRDVQINMSTTTRSPDGLSTLFAENVGINDTIVHQRGELRLDGTREVFRFPTAINLQTPFLYKPTDGNLLLDVRLYQTGFDTVYPGPHTLDAETTLGDAISRVWSIDVNASTARVADTTGFVALFEFVPVPEPSTIAVLAIGISGLALVMRRKLAASKCAPKETHGIN